MLYNKPCHLTGAMTDLSAITANATMPSVVRIHIINIDRNHFKIGTADMDKNKGTRCKGGGCGASTPAPPAAAEDELGGGLQARHLALRPNHALALHGLARGAHGGEHGGRPRV